MKAIAKRVVDRYHTAQEFADDLHQFLAERQNSPVDLDHGGSVREPARDMQGRATSARSTESEQIRDRSSTIVPKGMRSFDEQDSDFFLQLLPRAARSRRSSPEEVSASG